jgi:ribokinase
MNPNLLVVGSLNADFVVRVGRFPLPGQTIVGQDFQVFPGGKGANQAYAAAKLGARVSMVGQVGHDSQARWLIDNLASVGIDVAHVQIDPKVSSGIAVITTDAEGQNQIVIVPGANGTFRFARFEAAHALLRRAGIVLLQLEIPVEEVELVARAAKASGALVILDPAPARPLPDSLLVLCDYLTPNETELAALTGTPSSSLHRDEARDLAKRLLARGVRKVIVKLGAQGALLVSPGQEHFWPAFSVSAVDTTAAGDAFNAGFAAALARGTSELEAGLYATAAAACSVQRPGAQPSMPTDQEVMAMIAARSS